MLDQVRHVTAVIAILAAMAPMGCESFGKHPAAPAVAVPAPYDSLLPVQMRFHSFTRAGVIQPSTGDKGIVVHLEMLDSFNDTTKAFGDFRFELYAFQPQSPDPRGRLLSTWTESLVSRKDNLLHWDSITRTYVFNLKYDAGLPGQYVLVGIFSSPQTPRLFTSPRVFGGGQ